MFAWFMQFEKTGKRRIINPMKEYPKVSIGVGALVVRGSQVLLVTHAANPLVWTIPSGFVQKGENLQQTLEREVKEETNTKVKSQGVVCVRQRTTKDGGSNVWVVVMAEYRSGKVTPDKTEVVRAEFLTMNKALKKKTTPVTKYLLNSLKAGTLRPLQKQRKLTHADYEVFA
jgi:ADP-ribose pyrophosphatase YjhB (NUDIX family)